MADTDISIAQAACLLMRIEPITAFDDNSAEAKVLSANYADLIENELSLYPWRFATKKNIINRLAEVPLDSEWEAAYQVPSDILSVETVLVNGEPIEYDRYYNLIYCNASEDDEVILEGIFKADESKWPPYFTRLIEFRLAEILASGVAMRGDLANYYLEKGNQQMLKARHRDSASQTIKAIRANKYRTARRNSRSV